MRDFVSAGRGAHARVVSIPKMVRLIGSSFHVYTPYFSSVSIPKMVRLIVSCCIISNRCSVLFQFQRWCDCIVLSALLDARPIDCFNSKDGAIDSIFAKSAPTRL